jgi:hypothetical protein
MLGMRSLQTVVLADRIGRASRRKRPRVHTSNASRASSERAATVSLGSMSAMSGGGGWTTGVYPRLFAALAALGAAAVAIVIVARLVHGLPAVASGQSIAPASSSAAAAATAPAPALAAQSSTAFPNPPAGSVVFGKQYGADALGLAVKPKGNGVGLQASLVKITDSAGKPMRGRFEVVGANGRRAVAAAVPCGNGCYRASVAVPKPRKVTVVLDGHDPASATFALPAAWPPRSGAAIVTSAVHAWLKLRTMIIRDHLGDGRNTLDTVWTIVAPDKVAFAINDGEESIVIGNTRWTKAVGSSRWVVTPQLPVTQPQPFWVTATDARVLGTVSVNGKPAWKVSFFDPKTPGWYTILVDKATKRTVEMWMTARAHFMHDRYSSFDAPLEIKPPPAS